MTAGIYQIRNVHTGKVYLGETADFESRFKGHRKELNGGRHRNKALLSDWRALGADAFTFDPVAVLPEVTERRAVELAAIRSLFGDRCYNVMTEAAPSNLGMKHTAEAKARIRAAQLGRKLTPKQKEALRMASIGRVHTPEARAKNRAAHLGMRHTPEAKAKIAARRGWQHTPETKAKISATQRARRMAR